MKSVFGFYIGSEQGSSNPVSKENMTHDRLELYVHKTYGNMAKKERPNTEVHIRTQAYTLAQA
jgi:hypothetical protein